MSFAKFISLVEKYQDEKISDDDIHLLKTAFDLGEKAHNGQFRANGGAYFSEHCVPVALNVASLKMNVNMIAAALLHDVIEDTEVTKEEISQICSMDIAEMVDGVSKLSKVKYKGNDRHVESLRKFFVAIAKDARVVIIKLCDRWHNLETLHFLPEEKRERIAKESILIHAQLASRLGMGKLSSTLKDLAFPYAYPEQYKKTTQVIKEAMDLANNVIESMFHDLEPMCVTALGYKADIDKRVKGLYSSYKKLERKNWNVQELHDLVALRVIVKELDDCYRMLGAIHAKWHPVPGRLKDYIALPKPNGYKSLHTTVISKSGLFVEIQVRTQVMHAFDEYGIASHHSYKNRQSGEIRESFEWLSQLGSLNEEKLSPDEYIHELRSDFFEDRIFALTPKGDVIDLPAGATLLDFAYSLHSDIGDKAQGGKINGKYCALNTVIPSESVVEITVSARNKPSEKWLEWVRTNHARVKIKRRLSLARTNV